jgi:hypothetical protein
MKAQAIAELYSDYLLASCWSNHGDGAESTAGGGSPPRSRDPLLGGHEEPRARSVADRQAGGPESAIRGGGVDQ